MDPEPGRCRRTDGKKWRCSRDAVPDQKYCERHINRGRHRSRKPVEGQNGHNTNAAAAASAASKAAAAATTVVAMRGSDNNNSLAAVGTHHLANPSMANSDRVQNAQGASVFPTAMNLQSKESHQKQSSNPFQFGLISSDSLLNPSHKQPSYANSSKGFGSYLDFSNQAKNSNVDSWTEELKSDWTQLSMAIPMAPSSPVQDKLALSPLRLSREFDPAIHMGLGVNTEFLEPVKKTNNWIPISWGNNNSMGGPLGEVLNSTTNSPKFGSSPTGVLQKSTFGSLSNSSSGSSTVLGDTSNKNCDGKDPLGPTTLMNSSASAPSL